mmetsp:Transcript_35239/g.43492  ORF Transcript_35239/g.43492 Transcript_35239/m.43492 type:complete len:290 (+) Transcript_35239:295-1164(+)
MDKMKFLFQLPVHWLIKLKVFMGKSKLVFSPLIAVALFVVIATAESLPKESYIAKSLKKILPQRLFEPLRFLVVPVFISDECFSSLLINYELADYVCIKDTVSKVAGYAIIVLSSFLKVPIIVNIMRSGTVSGLAISSVYIEISMYMTIFAYNYFIGSPISTYGETLVLMIQNFALCLLLWKYNKKSIGYQISTTTMFAVFAGCVYITTEPFYWVLITWSITCSCLSKVPQIYTNFMLGHTGVLSIITSLMQVVGGLVRFLTVLNEVTDKLAITANGTALLLNILSLCR